MLTWMLFMLLLRCLIDQSCGTNQWQLEAILCWYTHIHVLTVVVCVAILTQSRLLNTSDSVLKWLWELQVGSLTKVLTLELKVV
jgi:hypothetical protein